MGCENIRPRHDIKLPGMATDQSTGRLPCLRNNVTRERTAVHELLFARRTRVITTLASFRAWLATNEAKTV